MKLDVDDTKILPEYLCSFINFEQGKQQIIKNQRGAAMKHINVKQLEMSKIYVPGLAIQKKYVAFLHQVDKSKFDLEIISKNIRRRNRYDEF